MSAFAWLCASLAAWLLLDFVLVALWARHRRREKAGNILAQLEELDRLAAREAQIARDVAAARATRLRLLAAAADTQPEEGPK